MSTNVVLVEFDGPSEASARLAEVASAGWPGASEVTVQHTTPDDLMDGHISVTSRLYLLTVSPDSIGAQLYQVLDALCESHNPVLVMTEDATLLRERLAGDEVIICDASESNDIVQMRLEMLCKRQAVVDDLKSELKTSRRFQGGLWGEVTRIQDELQLAAMVQSEFLPKTIPEVGDVRFDVFFRPAGYVSGDIYDIKRLDEAHVGFFLADAVGHGVPAALLTMAILRSLHTKDIRRDGYRIIPPVEVLDRLNTELLRHQGQGGRFATAVYGVINVERREVTLAGAGHPHPLLVAPDGSFRPIETRGGLLGVFPDAEFDAATFEIAPDERLVLFSDGFETAFPKTGDGDGHSRRLPTDTYIDCLCDLCRYENPVSSVSRRLSDLIDQQAGSLHQLDDLTSICIGTAPVTTAAASASDDFETQGAE